MFENCGDNRNAKDIKLKDSIPYEDCKINDVKVK